MKKRLAKGLALSGAVLLAVTACSSASGDSGEADNSAGGGAIAEGDGVLKIGTNLPQTGSLAFLGPPEFAGVDLAIQEINEAGGVLGNPVEVYHGDSGDTSTNVAVTTADEQLQRGVDAVIGAASSSVSLTIIDKITSAGVVQISPANTSTAFTDYNDNGLYFRTAPSDTFQGAILAELAISDGKTKPAIMVLQDAYGETLAEVFEENYTAAGGSLAADPVFYDPKAASFEAEVGQIKAANPDAVVMIGFDETAKVMQEFIKQGLGPQDVQFYFVDGNLSNSYDFPAGTLAGTKGTLPGSESPDDFKAALLEVNPDLEDFSYAPESYDATIVLALAAVAAGNDSGTAIASELANVTSGGTVCTTYAECVELLEAGEDIDYNGRSGPIDFDANGDPAKATMGVYEYGQDNTYSPLDFISGDVPQRS